MRKLISVILTLAMAVSLFPMAGVVASASDEFVAEQNVALDKTVTGAYAQLVDGIEDDTGIADWTDFGVNGSNYNGHGLKFVEVDLSQSYDVKRAYIKKRTTYEGAHPVSIWAYDEKKTSVEDIVDGDGLVGTIEDSATTATFTLESTKTARYIYLTSTPSYVGIYELKIYADAPLPTQTIYVSSAGTDSASGATASEPTTFATAKAATVANTVTEVVMLDNMSWASFGDAKGYVKIKGNTSGITLTFGDTALPMYAAVEFSNLTLDVPSDTSFYANGKRFKIDENCTTTNRIAVYGGGGGSTETYSSTELILLGGNYNAVCGGGSGQINGDTHITFGGNANKDDGISDLNTTTLSPTYIYGSGSGGVTGKTNITISDNAVARYIIGASASSTTPEEVNININGGKVMNVYGGSETAGTALSIPTVNINMTGGDVESIFGGNYGGNLTGNVFINWEGGNVRRRIYTGCYNNYDEGFLGIGAGYDTSAYVVGSTVLSISGNGTMTPTELGSATDNNNNLGIYPGSRYSSASSTEHNTIIYQNDCYDSAVSNYNIVTDGTKQSITGLGSVALGGYIDYTVKSGTGGKTYGTATAGTVYIEPEGTKYGVVGSTGTAVRNANATVSATDTITFNENFKINSVTSAFDDTGITVAADITANNYSNNSTPMTIAALYDSTNRFVGCDIINTSASQTAYNFDINAVLDSGEIYTLAVMVWDANRNVMVNKYQTTITK